MRLSSAKEIQKIDYLSSSKYKISSKIRMEIAGYKSFELIKKIYNPKKVLVIIGTGNNGGDGLVIARYLELNGTNCEVLIVKNSSKSSSDYKENLKIIKKLEIKTLKELGSNKINSFDLIVDSIFGVGLNRKIDRKIGNIIKKVNMSKLPVCSIDLPLRKILPPSTFSSPMHIENRVVLPQPLGPNTPTHSPGKTLIDNFFKIGLPSNDLLTLTTSNIGLSFLNFKILKPFFI